MSVNYLHGVETIESEEGSQDITIVRSSIIALFGIAPTGSSNVLIQSLNAIDDAQFGLPVPGFNIPKTLAIIRGIAGSTPILVVNVFNATTNTTQVTAESQVVANGAIHLAFAPVGAVTVLNSDGSPATIIAGTDYSIDAYGKFLALSSAVVDGTAYKFTYKKLNAGSVTTSQLIGGIDGSGNRTGIALYDLAYNTFGYKPKIFLSPTYSSLSAIVTAMATAAAKFRAVYLVDAPYGTTVAGAIAGRGVGGSIVFNTSDERAQLLYPYVKSFDDATQADADYPYSAFMAGVIVANDLKNGYWYSPSNKVITNATGSERMIEWSIQDSNCEANNLNAAGITTIAAGYGLGIRTWGNRNAAFPSSTSVKNFVNIRRADDMVIESMELATIDFADQPLTQAFIDAMREAGNSFLRTLIGRKAILPGSQIKYNKDDNPSSQLAAGKVVFERRYMIPTPAEWIVYKDILDISLLNQFK